jgi:hypothetical protein
MPVLKKRIESGNLRREEYPESAWSKGGGVESEPDAPSQGLLPVCGNERCRTSWLKLWRRRLTPRFEGAWACSSPCLEEMVRSAMSREAAAHAEEVTATATHQHRVPLGLMLYSQGVITQSQLRAALDAQKQAAQSEQPQRRIGRWLIQQRSLNELQLARALSAQWNCPLYSAERLDVKQAAQLLPRLLVESCGVVPLRRSASGRLLIAYEERLDHCVNLALERMHRVPVEAGVLPSSEFRSARAELIDARFPKLRLIEVANRNVLVRAMVKRMEEFQPLDATLVRVHEYFWLRMWRTFERSPESAEDLLAVESDFV